MTETVPTPTGCQPGLGCCTGLATGLFAGLARTDDPRPRPSRCDGRRKPRRDTPETLPADPQPLGDQALAGLVRGQVRDPLAHLPGLAGALRATTARLADSVFQSARHVAANARVADARRHVA